MPSLSQVALEIAVSKLGVHEQGGANRGPEVEAYLAMARLPPGQPWCAAFALWCYEMASRRLGVPNPFPRTGSCLRLWELADHHFRDSNPAVGSVYVLKHSATTGHVGIVESLDQLGNVASEVSANTNRDGSREGNCVWMHHGQPEVTHHGLLLGYLNFDVATVAVT